MFDNSNYPKRLRRADSFLGIHFDFHAGDDCTEIGKTVTREMIGEIIDKVHPDYLQCDCKGHRGLSSYPTKAGNPAPGFVKDQLRIWREVTAERGVSLFMHYSGVFDIEALKKHPSWSRIDENGKRDKKGITSVFGPYVDKLFIPQMKELSDDYGVDGIWVDGECWATAVDYGKKALESFKSETGIENVPKSPDDPHYNEFREFCREGFRRYLRHYVDEMHKHNPNFQIASNWAFTSQMPEPVSADVDFISGDYPLQDSVNSARFEGRCIARQGKPWDLMAWSFAGKWGEGHWTTKTASQLQQEAAVVLALGGGFQAYFTQNRDASVNLWQMDVMAETAKFCRERQPFCHRAELVPQVAVLFSRESYYRKGKMLFAPWGGELVPLQGILNALLDSQNSVEVVMEHQLAGRMNEYPVIVVPEWDYLAPEFIDELKRYVKDGGNLILVGSNSVQLFAEELDIAFDGDAKDGLMWIDCEGRLASSAVRGRKAKLGKKARGIGSLCTNNNPAAAIGPTAAITPLGKGNIAGIFADLGSRYKTGRTTVARDLLSGIVRELFPNPLVEVSGSHFVDVVPTRKDGKLMVNLVNTAGPHHDANVYTFDYIPPVGPLDIMIRTGEKPKSVTRQPAGEKMEFELKDGVVKLTLPKLDIHDILVVE